MSSQDLGLRIRTQSSYEFSLESSRSSKFLSAQSLILEDIQQSRGIYVQFFNLNQKQQISKSSLQEIFEPLRKGTNPTSKTQYIVMYQHEQNHLEQNNQIEFEKKVKQDSRKKQLSNTIAFYPHYNRNLRPISFSIPLPTLNLLNSYKRCPLFPQNDLMDHAYGAMFGFVIGDSVGSYLVHQNVTEISDICTALEMKNGGRFSLCQGQGTDETEMCLALSEGLLESFQEGSYDKNIIAKKYFEWIESQPFDFPTLAAISFSQIRKQQRIDFNESIDLYFLGQSLIRSSSRNINHQSSVSLIRVIPLVLISIYSSQDRLISLIQQQMKFFTPNVFSTEVAVLYGLLLRQIILIKDHQLALHKASKWVYNNGSAKLIGLWKLFEEGDQITLNAMNMNNVSVPFLFALKEINKKQVSFIDSIFQILIKGYNTDTNCSIVMGLVGAVIGLNRIPNYYKNKVINCQVQKSQRKRNKIYCSSRIVQLVPKLVDCITNNQKGKQIQ